ncbi:V-set and transmembrane domain-containing protein 4-like isoform X1 [Xyrauchen texanus]|uniref:V-set and transmembrane domain-containing protein 4-like isoform X1 n=1 Tax=Xyrauchen texanus TaxID=154827 RepID=UPI0022418D93|nr:V-set and transmembrane domain-containing protein 4-like isoform X1 [Xyrauchen texanus]
MKLSTVAIFLLTRAFIGELCDALNVTVTPGPVSMCMVGDNITLSCLVSQKKRSSSVLVLRWLFLPNHVDEHLVVRMGMKKAKYYSNYSKNFSQTKFLLWEEMDGQIYRLLILNVSAEDGGNYTCKAQEIRKHRNKWRASANGTGSMELRDLYLYAVLICSIGLVCMLVFAMTITCQHLLHKRRLRASYNLVKCPENSSGETVTSVSSSSSGMHRKDKRHKPQFREITELQPPPQIPAKVPVPGKPRRSKHLKAQPTKTQMQRVAEDRLTYAELELFKPKPELKTESAGCAQLESQTHCMGTVYAQILFVEKQV